MNLFNKIFNNFNNEFDKFYDYTGHHLIKLILAFHVIYFITLLGVISINMKYINFFYSSVNIILCMFLIIRFNPIKEKHELRANDPKMIFSISFFLILNMVIIELIKSLYPNKYDSVKQYITRG